MGLYLKAIRIIDVSKPMTGEAKGGRRYWYVKWANGSNSIVLKDDVIMREGVLWLKQSES